MTDQVVMPPASLSAAAEMRPGPRIARKMASRLRPMRPTSRRPTLRGDCAIEASSTEDPRQALLPGERKHQIDGIVDGDDAVELALVVNDGQGELHGIITIDDAIDLVLPLAWKKRLPR